MFDDPSTEFREHAAFAYAQSKIDDRFETLIELGNKDSDADVRSQAWFWLAESGATESEAAIGFAIANDKSGDVREEAVFALSLLPEERAVKALAAVLEDRKLDKDVREQALFWLAQSESDEAFAYVDRLFSD
jgi:HEAT repeat protein